jgi:hypothetical protein
MYVTDLEKEEAAVGEIMPVAEALEVIAPVDPDQLVHVGRGVYEARWVTDGREAWDALSELARMAPRVRLFAESPHRPEGCARGLAVQFRIAALPYEEVETVQ